MLFTNRMISPIGWYETLLIAGGITKYALFVQQLVNVFLLWWLFAQSSDVTWEHVVPSPATWGATIFPSHLAMNHGMTAYNNSLLRVVNLFVVKWFLNLRTDHTATIFSLPFKSLLFCRLLYENFHHTFTLEDFESIQASYLSISSLVHGLG